MHGGLSAKLATAVMAVAFSAFVVSAASGQSEPSLGDVARKSRAQQASTPANSEANRLAAELQQEQEDRGTVPTGFESYRAEGYYVAVPAPFSIVGRDDTGVLLATAEISGVTTKVFAAKPIDFSGRLSEVEFQDLASRFWSPHGFLTCTPAKPSIRDHSCEANGNLFGYTFIGRARFIESDNRMIPVICFATEIELEPVDVSKRRLTLDQRKAIGAAWLRNNARRDATAGNYQLCDTVMDSIRAKASWAPQAPVARASSAVLVPAAGQEASSSGASLGEIARVTRKETTQQGKARIAVEAQGSMDIAPPGFVAHTNTQCEGVCWQESFLVPEKARHVKGGASENVYVVPLEDGSPVAIFFGHTQIRGGYSEFFKAQGVAETWFHAGNEKWGAATHMTRMLNGRQVDVSRARLTSKMDTWTEEIVVAEPNDFGDTYRSDNGNDTGFNFGCIFREERLAEGEDLCASVWESWRTHR
jgi:hypothetical protein